MVVSFTLPPSLMNTGEGVNERCGVGSMIGEACTVLFGMSIELVADVNVFTLHTSYAVSEVPTS